MIVIDSCVWIAYSNNKKTKEVEVLNTLLANQVEIAVTSVIILETIAGERDLKKYKEIKETLESFDLIKVDHDTIMLAIEIYRACQDIGQTMKYLDCMIAASCIQYDLEIFSDDKHFDIMAEVTKRLKVYACYERD